MTKLPNICRVEYFSVSPSNENTKKAKTDKTWKITYFFSMTILNKKTSSVKSMNVEAELLESTITKILIDDELKLLQSGCTPIKAH